MTTEMSFNLGSLHNDVLPRLSVYGGSLYKASWGGHQAIVEQLLQSGADVNLQGGSYDTALQAASLAGHQAIVERLLQSGADVNLQGGYYGTALQAASWGGQQAIVERLLQSGADVNLQGGHYGTALQAASLAGHQAIVEQLLQSGADVNLQGGHYGTALQAASLRGHQAVVEQLLQSGADINLQCGHYGTALQAASLGGHQEVEGLLRWHKKGIEISSAAQKDDWSTVQSLVTAGYDPNYGQSFMERPLAVAIMHANLEEAEFLLQNYAIRDLGDQFYPLRDAILRKSIPEAQAVLTRPRFLKLPKVETKRQTLQKQFLESYHVFKTESQSAGISKEFENFATGIDGYKRMWKTGMAGVRRLIKNRSPQNLQQVIGILLIASAMRKSIEAGDTFGRHALFLEDLDRWRRLAVIPQQRMLFDEIVFKVWSKRQNSTRKPDSLDIQEEDRYSLFETIREMVQRFATESSLPLAQLEHENFWEYYEYSEETSIKLYENRGFQNMNGVNQIDPQIGLLSGLEAAANDRLSTEDLTEFLDFDPGPKSLLPTLLMMGAIFACVIHFLFAFHSGYVFQASSRDLSTQLNVSYLEFISYALAGVSLKEIESDIRNATTSTLITLEGWALNDRCELIKSFLNYSDGWVSLEASSSVDGSSDQYLNNCHSTSLSVTSPTPSTLSSLNTSATSSHSCHICGKDNFSNTGNLNRHLRRHQNPVTYLCQNTYLGCSYSDVRKDNVKKHELKHCQWKGEILAQNYHT